MPGRPVCPADRPPPSTSSKHYPVVPMKSKSGPVVVCLAVIAVIVIAANKLAPDPVSFKAVSRESVFGTLSWLFVVALFVERAVEVIISVMRDSGASPLEQKLDAARQTVAQQVKIAPTVAADLGPVHDAQAALATYRMATKELAVRVSFVLSLFVSLAGVRAFASIVATVPPANWLFPTADMIVT